MDCFCIYAYKLFLLLVLIGMTSFVSAVHLISYINMGNTSPPFKTYIHRIKTG